MKIKVINAVDYVGIDPEPDTLYYVSDSARMFVCNSGSRLVCIAPSCDIEDSVKKMDLPTNCKNCGAPLQSHVCEYCGTKY